LIGELWNNEVGGIRAVWYLSPRVPATVEKLTNTSVCLPTFAKTPAFEHRLISWLMVNVPGVVLTMGASLCSLISCSSFHFQHLTIS
jgi:hypothetical protein